MAPVADVMSPPAPGVQPSGGVHPPAGPHRTPGQPDPRDRTSLQRVAEWLAASAIEIGWTSAGSLVLSAEADALPRGVGLIPLADDAVDAVVNFGSIARLPEADLVRWMTECRRVARRALWLSVPVTAARDRAWWEARLFAAGLRRHPRQLEVVAYADLEHEAPWLTLLLEPIPAAALARFPLTSLTAERELHMDMARESGRRSDAHIARYAMARRYLPSSGVVLDAACGLGYGSAVLGSTHPEVNVIGLDNSGFAVDYAAACFTPSYPNLQFRQGDVCDLSAFADASVELVVSFETIEHLRHPEHFLAEVRRVLVPGGRFVCSVPNMWVDDDGHDPNPWHFHVFDFAKLARLCAGFLTLEQAFRQTAGGGMTLHDAPRALEPVTLPVVDGAQDAEWWLVAAAKPRIAAPSGPRTSILALTPDETHPHFASWLPQTGRPIVHAPHPDSDFVFPDDVALVVAVDCYHEPNVSLLRRAMAQRLPVLLLADGVLEYRNTWDHPQLTPGALFQPVLGTKIACLGRSQARILESWGNAGRCEIIGAPRLDHYATRARRVRAAGMPARVLVMTALNPAFTPAQLAQVRRSLHDVHRTLQEVTGPDGRPIEVIWRITQGLEAELGVANRASDFSGAELASVLEQVDAVISTPSTAAVEAMLLGLPVATLDYCNAPAYVHTAWRITAETHIRPTVAELLAPPAARMLYQETMLHDALECATPAAPRMVALVERMIAQSQGGTAPATTRLVPVEGYDAATPANAFDLAKLYPDDSQFTTYDVRTLQVELGLLRRQVAMLGDGTPTGPRPGDAPVRTHRLLAHFADARRTHGGAEQAALWDVRIGGAASRALFLHPPATIAFTVPTGCSGRLLTAVAMHPDVWENPDSGPCEFIVRVDDGVAHHVILDPTANPADRRWHEISLGVPASEAGHHVVTFETRSDGSVEHRWALWRDPRFSYADVEPVRSPDAPGASPHVP